VIILIRNITEIIPSRSGYRSDKVTERKRKKDKERRINKSSCLRDRINYPKKEATIEDVIKVDSLLLFLSNGQKT
jgi:hypothetical protein